LTLVQRGETVVSLVPADRQTHPSVRRPVEMAGGRLREFSNMEALERAWPRLGRARLLVLTPISASKHHLPPAAIGRAVAFARRRKAVVFVDDAHLASRTAFYEEGPPFRMADVDLAGCSTNKHVAGPRAGVLVGRQDLIAAIRSRASELGLEAQAAQYVGVHNALRDFDPKPVAEAGRLARRLLPRLRARYGEPRVYPSGPGVSIGSEEVLEIACERAVHRGRPRLAPVEATALIALCLLREHGVLINLATAMPGSAPVVHLMMWPDGARLGLEGIEQALEGAFDTVSRALGDFKVARSLLLDA
jgi:L-seryl-tRNA(Ser) seleniumtransferase